MQQINKESKKSAFSNKTRWIVNKIGPLFLFGLTAGLPLKALSIPNDCQDEANGTVLTCHCYEIQNKFPQGRIEAELFKDLGTINGCGPFDLIAHADASRKCNLKNPFALAVACYIQEYKEYSSGGADSTRDNIDAFRSLQDSREAFR